MLIIGLQFSIMLCSIIYEVKWTLKAIYTVVL